MSHGIMELDRLAVGLVEQYGKAWHNHPNCMHFDGPVPYEVAKDIFAYEVEKVPLQIAGTNIVVPGAFSLIRRNGDQITILYPSVGERYEIIQNALMFARVWESIVAPDPTVVLESIGTLLNGQRAFINLFIQDDSIPGDNSQTMTRLMVTNSFGGDSYQACAHTTRIVCMNTLRIALAQGEATATIVKLRHTRNVLDRVERHLVDLSRLRAEVRKHQERLAGLISVDLDSRKVNEYLDSLIPLPKNEQNELIEGNMATRRKNQRDAILALYESKDDLQGKIARTLYALFQATIEWVDHESTVRNGDDEMGRYWDGIWGNKDRFKQKALDIALDMKNA